MHESHYCAFQHFYFTVSGVSVIGASKVNSASWRSTSVNVLFLASMVVVRTWLATIVVLVSAALVTKTVRLS